MVVHCRNAFDDLFDIFSSWSPDRVSAVIHCFCGSAEEAKRALDRGFYLGIGGIATFKNSAEIKEIARIAPLDKILLETDAPYLAPVPYRGKRNEPAFTLAIAEFLADLRSVSLSEIIEQTTANAKCFFREK